MNGDLGPASVARRGSASHSSLTHDSPQRAISIRELEALTSELCGNPSTCLVLAGTFWPGCHMHAGTGMTEDGTAGLQVQLRALCPLQDVTV